MKLTQNIVFAAGYLVLQKYEAPTKHTTILFTILSFKLFCNFIAHSCGMVEFRLSFAV